jgi:hypothetical protein
MAHGWTGLRLIDFVVHISSCGRHLAALLHGWRLVVTRDFERAARDKVSIYDLAFEVQLGSLATHLGTLRTRSGESQLRLYVSSFPLIQP